jgi:hypothetical protein
MDSYEVTAFVTLVINADNEDDARSNAEDFFMNNVLDYSITGVSL